MLQTGFQADVVLVGDQYSRTTSDAKEKRVVSIIYYIYTCHLANTPIKSIL